MRNKNKIVHIIQSLGGVDTSLRMITQFLNDEEFELVIIKDINKQCVPFSSKSGNPIKTYEVDFGREISLLKDFYFFVTIVKIIIKEKPQIIHTHSAKCSALGRLSGFLLKIPTLSTPHAFSYLSTDRKVTRKVFLFIEVLLKFLGGKIVACSESEKYRAIKDVGYNEENVMVFPNSLPLIEEPVAMSGSLKFNATEDYICTIGRPSFQKNTVFLIEVFYAMKMEGSNSKLIILGVGHYSPDLNIVTKKIHDLNLTDDVVLIPWSSRDETLRILAGSLFYISLSRYEGLPFAVLEAMRAGKPCIVSKVDGNKDCVIDNENGYLVELTAPTTLIAEKAISLLDSGKLLEKFGQRSRRIFEESFNIQNNIHYLERIYNSAI